MFRVQKFFITYEKSVKNKLSGRQNTQFLYAVNILTKIVKETKTAKYSDSGGVPSIFKMGCVNNALQVARHDHSYQKENLSKEQLFEVDLFIRRKI